MCRHVAGTVWAFASRMRSAVSAAVTTSVVIPVHNAELQTSQSCSIAFHDRRSAESWEVVVADNGSTDRSREIAAAFAGRLRLLIVPASDRRNPSYARNAGARAASGRKLLFHRCRRSGRARVVESLARALDHHALVTSRVDSVTLNPEWVRDAHGPPWQADAVGVFFDFLPATGVNVGVRRELFDELGGFPEQFSGSEDVAFSWRAHMRGARVHLVPEAVYVYRYRHTLGTSSARLPIGAVTACCSSSRSAATACPPAPSGKHGASGSTWRVGC